MFAYRILMIVLFGWHASLFFFFFFIIIELCNGIFIGNILRNMYDNMYFVWEEYWYEGKVNIDYCMPRISFVLCSLLY